MKVLHLNAGNMFGGIETAALNLARHADLCPDMEPAFAVCFEGHLSEALGRTGKTLSVLGPVRVSRPWTIWRARRRLRRLLGETRPDVAVCHAAWTHAVLGPAIRDAGVPLVFWLHNEVEGRHWLERWASWTQPDLAVCNSRFTADSLSSMFSDCPKTQLYHPIPSPPAEAAAERNRLRAELGAREGETVILQVSRLEPLKGQEVTLRALARMAHVPGWVCWQVGGPQTPAEVEYFQRLVNLAESLGLRDRVRFLGIRFDVDRLMAAADVFCQPNTRPEGFGVVFIEALYAGLPVVTTAMGGAMEIIDDECGVMMAEADPTKLADALGRLVADASLRRRLGGAGPARAAELCEPGRQIRRLHEALSVLPIRR